MRRIVFIEIFILFVFSFNLLAYKISLGGQYGGSLLADCKNLSKKVNGDFSGSCILHYYNYSTVQNWIFNGFLKVDVFSCTKRNEIVLKFNKNSKLILKNIKNKETHTISIPNQLNFIINKSNLKTLKVKSINNDKIVLNYDGKEIKAIPEFLHYFIDIFK